MRALRAAGLCKNLRDDPGRALPGGPAGPAGGAPTAVGGVPPVAAAPLVVPEVSSGLGLRVQPEGPLRKHLTPPALPYVHAPQPGVLRQRLRMAMRADWRACGRRRGMAGHPSTKPALLASASVCCALQQCSAARGLPRGCLPSQFRPAVGEQRPFQALSGEELALTRSTAVWTTHR